MYRESQDSLKVEEKKTLGQSLTPDGVHYLLALYVKVIQDSSGLKEVGRGQKPGFLPFSPKKQSLGPKLPVNLKIASSLRRNQDSFDYYEESEENELDYRAGGQQAIRDGIKQPDGASAKINVENQKNITESEKRHKLYLRTIREFYTMLSTDALILDSFKTTPRLLRYFNLTQLINSENVEQRDVGIKLSLLLYRYDANTRLCDITKDADAAETL